MSKYVSILARVASTASESDRRYGPYASSHEAYGVLAEEVMELLHAIHANARDRVTHEAIDVAAVAIRLAHACETAEDFQTRSGFRRDS